MKLFVLVLILFSASRLGYAELAQGAVIWNVGQGQWVTIAEGDVCFHFDMGGEFFPWERIKRLCGHRNNRVLFSHWDWDHIGALGQQKIRRVLPTLCIQAPPIGRASERKKKLLAGFPPCTEQKEKIFAWRPAFASGSNESSQIFSYHGLLVPGDSTLKQEIQWSQEPWVPVSRILVAGHHGSKTSTSETLLKRLPHLRMAISSARWRRYSHPHPETVHRLQKAHIPLLRTEDWGHIWID